VLETDINVSCQPRAPKRVNLRTRLVLVVHAIHAARIMAFLERC
jgi:hypothetical protein